MEESTALVNGTIAHLHSESQVLVEGLELEEQQWVQLPFVSFQVLVYG